MKVLAVSGGTPVRTEPFPSWPRFGEEEREALTRVLESGQWGTLGPAVTEFERRFAAYLGVARVQTVSNGTVSLETVLRALEIGQGDEVIVPPYTFVATVTAVLMVNATPVFADIDPGTLCIDPVRIEEAITGRTRAIIPVHMAGRSADMDRIMAIASRHGLAVIEDAAQAHGSEWRGRKLGSIGTAGSFSFQQSKNMTAGEGGAIGTNDTTLADLCWSIHHVGRNPGGEWYRHYRLASNYRLSEWQAAVLSVQLSRLDEQLRIRQANAERLDRLLGGMPGLGVSPRDERITRHTHHLYTYSFRSEEFGGLDRATFVKALCAEGIPSSTGYTPLNVQPFLELEGTKKILSRPIDYRSLELPGTVRACRETVWIPQNILLSEPPAMEDIARAIEKIRDNLGELSAAELPGTGSEGGREERR